MLNSNMVNFSTSILNRHSERSEESRALVAKTGFFALIKHQAQNDGA